MAYAPPTPPAGRHRYTTLMFEQPGGPSEATSVARRRSAFDIAAFLHGAQVDTTPAAYHMFKQAHAAA